MQTRQDDVVPTRSRPVRAGPRLRKEARIEWPALPAAVTGEVTLRDSEAMLVDRALHSIPQRQKRESSAAVPLHIAARRVVDESGRMLGGLRSPLKQEQSGRAVWRARWPAAVRSDRQIFLHDAVV